MIFFYLWGITKGYALFMLLPGNWESFLYLWSWLLHDNNLKKDLDIISPYNINSLSSRQFVKRRKKNINYGNILWSNNNSSELILEEIYGRQYKKNYLQDLGSERDIWLYKSYLFLFQLRKACKKAIILSGIIGQSIHMYFCSTLSRQISFQA